MSRNFWRMMPWMYSVRCGAMAAAAAVVLAGGVAAAQETTSTVAAAEPVAETDAGSTESLAPLAVLTPESGSGASAPAVPETTQTVVLMGEKVSLENENSAKGPFPDFAGLTTSTLGGRVVDLTTHGLSMAKTAEMVGKAVINKPQVVVIFTGFTDEKMESKDEDQQATLTQMVKGLKKTNARVFLVPAATTVGAMTNANLMLAATETGATYIPIGTEVGGQPLQDAFVSIQTELQAPAVYAEEPAPAAPRAVTIQGKKITTPNNAPTPAAGFDQTKADLQKELDRIAGESNDTNEILPSLGVTTVTEAATQTADDGSTIPPGGVVTKRGPGAQENINMRPLPAVKAFRPKIPVPRNQVDTKEPALSR